MRILHVIGPERSGGATVAAESVAHLVGGQTWRIPPATPYRQAVCTIGGYCDPRARWLMRDVIRAHRPDVVHLHDVKRLGTAAVAGCVDLGVPAVWSCYDFWPLCPRDNGYDCCSLVPGQCGPRSWSPAKGRDWPLLAKVPLLAGRKRRIARWWERLSRIVCLSVDSAKRLSLAYAVPNHVIPLPIRVPDLKAVKDPDYVLFLGGDAPHKGKHVFLAAADLVRRERPEVRCVALRAQSREHALWELAKASVLVVPEMWPNPGPVVVTEAGLLGTRVVASYIGGIPEMAVDYCPAPFSAVGFADSILRCLGEPGGLCRLSPCGSGTLPDYAGIREKLLEVYRLCASRSR